MRLYENKELDEMRLLQQWEVDVCCVNAMEGVFVNKRCIIKCPSII